MVNLNQIVKDFALGMVIADSKSPQAINVRSKSPYKPGIGPHTESQTIQLVIDAIRTNVGAPYAKSIALEVPYPKASRSKCDLCIGHPDNWEWAVEVKMMRLLGDNGMPNDNILMHILSPYTSHRSAVTDCSKILESGLTGRKAVLIYGYDYPDWPQDPAIEAFEILASKVVKLSKREEATVTGLIHPVHNTGRVFAWEISSLERGTA